jgi:vancomycin permeability regulator SanA
MWRGDFLNYTTMQSMAGTGVFQDEKMIVLSTRFATQRALEGVPDQFLAS